MDCIFFLWHGKWNMYLYNHLHLFLKDGVLVKVASNYDRRCQKKMSKYKYEAIFF